jgi:transposase InsO family protein
MVSLSDLGESPEIDVLGTAQSVSMHTGGTHREMALLDSATTHTILRDPLFFSFSGNNTEAWQVCKMLTIAGRRDFKFREGQAKIVLPGGATLLIERAIYAPSAHRSLISFKDLRAHGDHTFTVVKGHSEALELLQGTAVIATAYAGISGLYELPIVSASHPQFKGVLASDLSQSQTETSQKLASPGSVPAKIGLWHNRMGHPGTTMFRRMIPILSGHEVCQGDANKVGVCSACAQGKMINRPSRWKLPTELPPRLHRLHGDICGPITPASGPFRYFMVLVDAAGIHFEVSLLSTRNIVFAKLLAMFIKFRTHNPDFPMKTLRMDNAAEFKSQHFEDYCLAMGIELTYSVPYEHSQNGLAEAFIKKIQLISRPLLIQAGLPSYFWAHAVLHAATLLRYQPTLLNDFSPLELFSGQKPDISHFRVFGCQVWIPTVEPKRTTISKHRIEGVYVGFDSPSIIRYLTASTGTMHKARFQNSKFDENKFPSITSTKPSLPLEFWALETLTLNPDPRTALADTEVKKILDLKTLAEKLPDGFTNIPRITRNPLPRTGLAPLSIRPKKQPIEKPSKPVKRARVSHHADCTIQPELIEPDPLPCTIAEKEHVMAFVHEMATPKNDPLTLEQAKSSLDWPQWRDAIQAEYNSLRKHQVFGPLVTSLTSKPVGHKLIFVKKRDAKGDVVRYKVRLVAQGFTQRPGIDFQFTYSPVMDSGTFRYLLGMAVQYSLDTQLLDVVTAYLYGPLDAHIYIKPPPEFLTQPPPEDKPGAYSGLRLQKALYGLKQAGRMWYKHLHDYLLRHHFSHDQASSRSSIPQASWSSPYMWTISTWLGPWPPVNMPWNFLRISSK